jgi:hypothetical protein
MRPLKCARPASAETEHGPQDSKPTSGNPSKKSDRAQAATAAPNATAARRPLPAWQHNAAEPRRLAHADIERMCAELPYGFWRDATGRLVIFNRRYRPLWQRLPSGTIERANPYEWIKFIEQRWFNWGDARYEKTARERLRQILRDFFAGKDLAAHTIVTERDLAQRAAARGVRS